jgi:hypothetical protein
MSAAKNKVLLNRCLIACCPQKVTRFFATIGTFLVVIAYPNRAPAESGLHFFDATRNQACLEIKTAFTNIQLDQVMGEVRSNFTLLSAKELEVVAAETRLVRDTALFAALNDPRDVASYFGGTLIDGRLNEILGGYDTNTISEFGGDVPAIEIIAQRSVEETARFIQYAGKSPPAFVLFTPYPERMPAEFTNGLSAKSLFAVERSFATLSAGYRQTQQIFKKYDKPGSELGDILEKLNAEAQLRAQWQAKQKVAALALSGAIQSYTNAVSTNARPQILASNALQIVTLVKGLTTNTDVAPLAKIIGLNTQYNAVVALINAAASGSVTNSQYDIHDKQLGTAVQIASRLPGLINAVANVQAYAVRLPLSGLLLNKQLLTLQVEKSQKEIALEDLRYQSIKRQVDGLIDEATFLLKAHNYLLDTNQAAFAEFKTNSVHNCLLLSPKDSPRREALIGALIYYTASIQVAQQAVNREDAIQVQLSYEQAALDSENAIKQWQSLVESPITQLLDYYSTGFKADQVANTVVNALGLAAIAWRL